MQHRGTELQVKKKKTTNIKAEKNETSRLMEELKELFCKEQKKQTSSLGSLWFSSDTRKVLNSYFIISYLCFLVFFWRRIGSKLGVKPRKEKERILYPLTSSILSYIRMTIITFVFIIILYPPHYLLMKVDVSHIIFSQHMNWIFIFFIPGEGRARAMSGMSGSSLPQRHYCLGEWTSVAFQKSCVWMRSECVWETEKCRYLGLWFHFGPFEKCSYFSSLGFLRYR